jgi:hypothetical protein
MTQPQLIPKPPRRMKQPRKDEIRRRLEVAQARAAYASTPRWWRLWNRLRVRVVETDKRTAAEQVAVMEER